MMDESLKKVKYSAKIPYKSGSKWETANYYGGREDLSKIIIAQLEKKDPKDRERVPIYFYGKKIGTVYWKNNRIFGAEYVFEAKGFYEILYKNGNTRLFVEKPRRA